MGFDVDKALGANCQASSSSDGKLIHANVSEAVIGAAIKVHQALGPGLLESAYEICRWHELTKGGWNPRRQVELAIQYDGLRLDCGYRMDLVVDDKVLVELKSVDKLAAIHEAQLNTYLRISGLRVGLLINFNSLRLKDGIVRRVIRPNQSPPPWLSVALRVQSQWRKALYERWPRPPKTAILLGSPLSKSPRHPPRSSPVSHRTPIVGGNWKMNTDLASAVELADDIVAGCADLQPHCDIAVFPPFPYLQAVGKTLGHSGILLGAQDVYHEANGAFTGEVSAEMLVDLNVQYVLCGHSERRHVIGETDELVNLKTQAALDASLCVILCVGETIEQREAGQTEAVNLRQLRAGLDGVPEEQMRQVVIAYEPVWAIGTGRTATADDAESVHRVLRAELAELYGDEIAEATRIQYGGSVKAGNAGELFSQPNIDGGLIGGASLKSEEFLSIVRVAVESDRLARK